MITDRIREFMDRDWRAARVAKDAYWSQRIARLGWLEAWRVADELRQQALRLTPAWPREADRHADFLDHVRLAEVMRRAAPARRP